MCLAMIGFLLHYTAGIKVPERDMGEPMQISQFKLHRMHECHISLPGQFTTMTKQPNKLRTICYSDHAQMPSVELCGLC